MSEKSQERSVPTSRLGRVSTFAPMVLKIAADVTGQYVKSGGKGNFRGSGDFTEENLRKPIAISTETTDMIVKTFTKARGAALKIGQFVSMQDENVVPAYITKIFDRVRDSADFMPFKQVESVLVKELGKDWRKKFSEFEEKPFAAASIGQVHRAVTLDGKEIAVKVQYPGIADSIDSDFANVEKDVSSKRILATDLIRGGLTIDECTKLPQETRNFIVRNMIRLAFYQLFTLRFMQTDPNFANYFWDDKNKKVWLIDFGATQEYSKEFIDVYIDIINGAVLND